MNGTFADAPHESLVPRVRQRPEVATTAHGRNVVGTMLGPYRVISILGSGGASKVYLAERADRQYAARVAVKIIESATLSRNTALRFHGERQILSTLIHPNIVRLHDAGETADGLPYLVMEHVEGNPIDQFCDQQNLDIKSRLNLFLKVCEAVHFAHQNLVIHRDLKPANILVTKIARYPHWILAE